MTDSWMEWTTGGPVAVDEDLVAGQGGDAATADWGPAAPFVADGSARDVGEDGPEAAPLVVVAGHRGGAGATTTAIGLALALDEHGPVVLDETGSDGDLLERGALTGAHAAQWWSGGEQWVRTGRTLWRAPAPQVPYPPLPMILAQLGRPVVVDTGAGLAGAGLHGLAAPAGTGAPLPQVVLAIAPRAGEVNRLPGRLDVLTDLLGGPGGLTRAHLVVCDTRAVSAPIVEHLLEHLSGRVGSVTAIPHDPHIAECGPIDPALLDAATARAFADLAARVCGAAGS
ncbi:MinD/ParA family ATP-binding protein [Rhodococcus rhodnii]|uniref:MinD/ParA family ATP-binding protein n=1 Tax=Rhodococcus rhodnii TaxID=38312 RepID=UPI000932C92C|nr:hypothetical protein [Rhodococcus rhodnii]